MKTKSFLSNLRLATLLVAAITLFATTGAFAAGPYYWDGNDNAAGFGTASGTWAAPTAGTTTAGWSTDGTGVTVVNGNSVTTGTADALNFGTATAGLATGTITVSGNVTNNSMTFGSLSGAITLSGGAIYMGGTSPVIISTNTGNIINSPLSLLANVTIFSPNPNNGILTLGGAISGGFNVSFGGKNTGGSSQKILLNAASSYTGSTAISTAANSGANNIVQLGIDNALPTTTSLNLGGNDGSSSSTRWTRLDLNGYSQTISNLTASGINYRQLGIINSSATLSTLTVSNASADTFIGQIGYYGGPFTPAALGAGGSISYLGLTKQGAGKLTLNPSRYNNYYTGPTTVSQGVLEFAGGAQLAYGNTYTNTISIASGAALLFSGTAANPLGGAISGSGALTNSGTGTVTLNDPNSSFTGTMAIIGTNISGNATLALGASGDIGGATLVIGTNATFDVSAQTTYTLGSSAALKASGKGTSAVTQATIKGGTTVSLGAQPITLTWGGPTSGSQTANPCLVISQGALTLNNNPFTINGTTLGVGTYRLIQVGDGSTGTLNQNVSPAYSVTGTAIDGAKINVVTNDGSGNVILSVTLPFVASTNAFLKSLVLNPAGTLSPSFATNTFTYTSSEAIGVSPTVTVTNADLTATNKLILNGGTPVGLASGVASSPLTLALGITNTITVQVTAQDTATIYNYTVNVWVPSASPYYWDGNNNTAGFGAASGTWSAITAGTATSGWSTNANGTNTVNGNSVATGTNDALNFGSVVGVTTNALSGGTITVSGTVNAGSLTFSPGSGGITLSGGTAINLADSSTISIPASAIEAFTTPLAGAGTSLLITGGGTAQFKGGNAGFGSGGTATIAGGSTLQLSTGGGNGLGGSGGYTVNLGDATTAGNILLANSVGVANPIVVVAGSGGRTITLNDNNSTPAVSGSVTANENLTINFLGFAAGKNPSVSGTGHSIDAGKTVTFNMIASGDILSDSATWGGSGSILYTVAGGAASSTATFSISGAKTYSGGATINNFTNGGSCVVNAAGTSWPTSGPLGIGTLTLGSSAALRSTTSADTTLGNAVTLAGNVTFPTNTSEKSLIFTGDVDLGSATRTLTCNVGTIVGGKLVDFQGVISNTGGINMAGTGTLRLSGANTYTGNTTVSSGTLSIAQATLATNSTISISNGAVLNLEFGGVNVVAGLVTNGVSLAAGVYGSAEVAPFITGSGSLQVVSTGPSGPATITNSVSGSTLSLSWPAGQGWRLQQQTNALSVGLSTNWDYVTDGSVSSTNITVDATQPTVFYRLRYP